jgi:hypothetical protein
MSAKGQRYLQQSWWSKKQVRTVPTSSRSYWVCIGELGHDHHAHVMYTQLGILRQVRNGRGLDDRPAGVRANYHQLPSVLILSAGIDMDGMEFADSFPLSDEENGHHSLSSAIKPSPSKPGKASKLIMQSASSVRVMEDLTFSIVNP